MTTPLSYFEAELTRLDTDVIKPVLQFTWERDISVVPLNMSDRFFAFDEVSYTAVDKKISWANPNDTELPAVGVKYSRSATGTQMWAQLIRHNVHELQDAIALKRNLSGDLFEALNAKYQSDMNQLVYLGDAEVGAQGLLNSTKVTNIDGTGSGGVIPLWTSSVTNDTILSDLQTIFNDMYDKTRVAPNKILLPLSRWSVLSNRKYNEYGMTLINFIETMSPMANLAGGLSIKVCHDCVGAAGGGKDRLVMYRDDVKGAVLPASGLQSLPAEQRIFHVFKPYYMNAGQVTFKRPEVFRYAKLAV